MSVTMPGVDNQYHDKCYINCYRNLLQGHLNQICSVKKDFLEKINSTLLPERGAGFQRAWHILGSENSLMRLPENKRE